MQMVTNIQLTINNIDHHAYNIWNACRIANTVKLLEIICNEKHPVQSP
jgi:hypothetical protein